ncbi:flagellar hook-associated protein FlgK [Shewanella halifaxensis HAW-EB4]|uniref:Flagellar hook-associated protein 1 n=1 Tax=Shewanella halifaxensis (strain HAW-EB4) TaxID=458817 RepID=B0TMD3_SHEHH|nr:flagellar hook-associated protein FlgK [Shewanella halifaxensis]ABZ76002.1 flagellar hook-associated protein FlgK [Shewanella halifaxensis HAW-EB4]
MSLDLMNIARTGVLASQSQLAITSNNIANANTAGYNRQVVSQSALDSQRMGNEFYGAGTYVSDVKRVYNDYATRELRIGSTAVSESQTTFSKMSQLDQLFSQMGKAVPQGLNDFFASMNALADIPNDMGLRGSFLTSANQLANSVNQMQSHLDSQMTQTNDQISAVTDRINEISNELGSINRELMKSQGQDMQLLDKQDALILELSEYASVNVIPLESGAKSIMLGGSMMLVSGEMSMQVGTAPGDPYPNELQITAQSGSKSMIVDASKMGGQLGALVNYRDETLIPSQMELGQFALGVSDAFNQAQAQGFDLNGQVGANIFTDINDPSMQLGRVGALSSNTGTANLSVNIDDVGSLTGSSYELKFTAPSTYELKDAVSGNITPLTLNGTKLEGANGFSINIDAGALASGDTFEIRPTSSAAVSLSVEMTDAKGIAAAGAKITADAANTGNSQVSLVSIDKRTETGFPVTGAELTFEIDPSTTPPSYEVFDVDGASLGADTYTPPTISSHGFTFEIDSTATAAEKFTFDLSFAEGDNTNMVSMAKLSEAKLMNGGKTTLTDVFENTTIDVGSKTKSAEISMGSAEAIYKQAYTRVQSVSGVNLDEEAANLMRFQQSYQASARIMTTANEIFNTLFSSLR